MAEDKFVSKENPYYKPNGLADAAANALSLYALYKNKKKDREEDEDESDEKDSFGTPKATGLLTLPSETKDKSRGY